VRTELNSPPGRGRIVSLPLFLALSLALLLPLLQSCAPGGKAKSISVQELREALRTNPRALLLDVRNPEELEGDLGKLDSAMNIPVQDLDRGLSLLAERKGDSIYVICRSGNRSKRAAEILTRNGFAAFNVTGGMREWRARFGAAGR
jgi:rhodanese-related sulfurtransferase